MKKPLRVVSATPVTGVSAPPPKKAAAPTMGPPSAPSVARQLGELKKMAQMGGLTSAVSRVAPQIWSPMMQLTSMVLPRALEEKNMWRRWYYQHDPVVGSAIDIHTRYPISQFRLRCDGDDGGSIAEEYMQMSEDISLFDFLLSMSQEQWVVGEAFPYGIWNADNLTWDSFILMNPDYVDVQKDPFAQRQPQISLVKWAPEVRLIVNNGPNHPKTGPLYQHLANTASDILMAVKTNQPYKLSPMAVSHLARKVSYHDLRGTSIIDKLFKVLMYEDRLGVAQMAGADRYQTPVEVWTVGNDEVPASQEDLSELEGMLLAAWNSPQKAVIWNHTLHAEMISGASALLPLAPELEWTYKQKMAGLMINEAILTGEGPTFANASVAMDVMVAWYSAWRQQIETWMQKNVFEPVAKARGYYRPTKKELIGGYRDKTVERRPLVPKVVWDKASLRDDYQKLQTFIQLAGQNRLPWSAVYEMLNQDPDTVLDKIEKEAKQYMLVMQRSGLMTGPAAGGDAGAGMGLDMAGGGGGGMGELGGGPMEEGGGLPGMPPEVGPDSPGGLTMPPESVGAAPGAGPAGFA